MRYLTAVLIFISNHALAEEWQKTDCMIVEKFAREAVSPDRNPDLARIRLLENQLDEAIARLPGDDLDAVIGMMQPPAKSGLEWPNGTTEMLAALLQDRCGIRLD